MTLVLVDSPRRKTLSYVARRPDLLITLGIVFPDRRVGAWICFVYKVLLDLSLSL